MPRRKYRRESNNGKWFTGKRRIIAAVATLAAFGGIVTITQVSNASVQQKGPKAALAACDKVQAPKQVNLSSETQKGQSKKGQVADDGAGNVPSQATMRQRCRNWVMQNAGGANPSSSTSSAGTAAGTPTAGATTAAAGNGATPPPGAGLGVLANSCANSTLAPHSGFQDGDRCVSTAFGEVGLAANNPTLLITSAPKSVTVNTPFTLKVSTRNLIRDRFLAAGAGGYYVESSVLENDLVRGHFHTACRMLGSTTVAPPPDPTPAFFVATEDSKGGATPDTVTINVPGLPTAGTAQCASWAGDGSHRIPMMQKANMIPAFDAVKVTVRDAGGNQAGGNQAGGNQAGGN